MSTMCCCDHPFCWYKSSSAYVPAHVSIYWHHPWILINLIFCYQLKLISHFMFTSVSVPPTILKTFFFLLFFTPQQGSAKCNYFGVFLWDVSRIKAINFKACIFLNSEFERKQINQFKNEPTKQFEINQLTNLKITQSTDLKVFMNQISIFWKIFIKKKS